MFEHLRAGAALLTAATILARLDLKVSLPVLQK
jgi:hypothetical protein